MKCQMNIISSLEEIPSLLLIILLQIQSAPTVMENIHRTGVYGRGLCRNLLNM